MRIEICDADFAEKEKDETMEVNVEDENEFQFD